ncbi:hypothetical protein ABZZ37_18720 [Streptomyces sp. NPDC006464]|uniref:hypothetical protein n=1 Tax=Streptomyces sp. NPDC006464 TaxID=3154305 RepID=UPI0033A90DF3
MPEGLAELYIAQAFDRQAAELPLTLRFLGLVYAQIVVHRRAAERGIDAVREGCGVIRQQSSRVLLLSGGGFSDRGVQSAEVAAGPMVGRVSRELGELDQGWRPALRGHEPVVGPGEPF